MKIAAQLIFKAPSVDNGALTLSPPSPYARRVPLHTHPSAARPTPLFRGARFKAMVTWAEDEAIQERNRAVGRGTGSPIGGAGLEWGAWLQLTDPADSINVSILPFLGDMLRNLPELLRPGQTPPS